MKVIDPGHLYLLDAIDGGEPQKLRFVKRIGEVYPGNEGQPYGGVNVQEVLRSLIDRATYLNHQIPCAETEAAIGLLAGALLLFEGRAARRHGRFLELNSLEELVTTMACPICGHLDCKEDHPNE